MRVRFVLLLVPLVGAACDSTTARYQTLTEARADGVFERGWLPDVLPPSAYDIRVRNDLDLNTSEGRFSFSSEDLDQLEARLRLLSERVEGPLAAAVETQAGEPYPVYRHRESGREWVFVCMPDQTFCRYYMQ